MSDDILNNTKIRMEKSLLKFQKSVDKMRIDRASPSLLNNILIEYYGSHVPLKDLSNIIVENVNTLKINIFDKSLLRAVEKAIFRSNLGVTPIVHENVIRVIFPPLTEERRQEICKHLQIDVESSKISIRNIRRYANDSLKSLVKKKIITLDTQYKIQNEIQILTDYYINKIDNFFAKKKSDIMSI